MKYTPAFKFKDTRFVIATRDFIFDTKDKADEVGLTTMFVEGILFGFKRDTDKPIQEIPEEDTEGKLFADSANLEGKDLGLLPVYLNIRKEK